MVSPILSPARYVIQRSLSSHEQQRQLMQLPKMIVSLPNNRCTIRLSLGKPSASAVRWGATVQNWDRRTKNDSIDTTYVATRPHQTKNNGYRFHWNNDSTSNESMRFCSRPFSSSSQNNIDNDPSEDKTDHQISTSTTSNKTPDGERILPGLALAGCTAMGGFTIASGITVLSGIPMSGIPISILLGMGIRNISSIMGTTSLSFEIYKPGVTVATKSVLQLGIVCVAAKLSLFQDVLQTGASSIPVVLGAVTAGMLWIPYCGQHLAGLSPTLSRLLAAGTSICGVTAITALAPAIQAPARDVAIAVANTVAFGTLGMLLYPSLLHMSGLSSEQIGMCLGVGIHDTSQVLGAALSYKETYNDEVVFQVAAVTKLLRNLGLAIAIPLLTYAHHSEEENQQRQNQSTDATKGTAASLPQPTTLFGLNTFTKYVPPFLMAFLGMSAFRSTGDYMLLHQATASLADASSSVSYTSFTTCMDFIGNDCSKYALGTAMAGVGLSTTADSLKNVGWKPFAVGFSGAVVVAGTGITIASFMV